MAAPTRDKMGLVMEQKIEDKTSQVKLGDVPERLPSSEESVLITGAGVAGLMAALECWRNGHDVQ